MRLASAHVTNFKSIDDAGEVQVDPWITVLVGPNESGKTAFLRALHKARPVDEDEGYDVVDDFPRRRLSRYEASHESEPAVVARLRYALTRDEVEEINADLGLKLLTELSFTVTHRIDRSRSIRLSLDSKRFVDHLLDESELPPAWVEELRGNVESIRDLITRLETADLDTEGRAFLEGLRKRFPEPNATGWSLLDHYVWRTHVRPKIPLFLYFDQYRLLTGKVSLTRLLTRGRERQLTGDDRTVLGLLRLANIQLSSLLEEGGYERATARLEAISNEISDQIFEYWTQNQLDGLQDLDVQIDIESDPADVPPFDEGKNLYIRIRSLRHRVSVPFDKRSKGFIWFFSFLIWFQSIRQQIDADRELILLLDEPGLSLHPLGQRDLLRYIDDLAKRHQVIFSTHSPFLVRSDRLHQVRAVQDHRKGGTKVTSNLADVDDRTRYPVRAALAQSLADGLFQGPRNLVVADPTDLAYLRFFSTMLKSEGRTGQPSNLVVVPAGGAQQLAAFVALQDVEQAPLVVLDGAVSPVLPWKQPGPILRYSEFGSGPSVEDLFTDDFYLQLLGSAYEEEFDGNELEEDDLSDGNGMVDRVNKALNTKSIRLGTTPGFDRYRVATKLLAEPPARSDVPDEVLDRFEQLFKAVDRAFMN